jgi:hypothetical protein
MTAEEELAAVRSQIRRLSLSLKTVLIRQSARRAFDLPRFGTGPFERLAAAIALGAVFFFVFLSIGYWTCCFRFHRSHVDIGGSCALEKR